MTRNAISKSKKVILAKDAEKISISNTLYSYRNPFKGITSIHHLRFSLLVSQPPMPETIFFLLDQCRKPPYSSLF